MNKKTWEDAKIGEDLGSIQYRLTSENISRYLRAIEDRNPWYVQESPFGGPIAPPLITADEYIKLYYDNSGYIRGRIFHAKMEHEIIRPPHHEELITARGKIVDKYVRRGRTYVILETVVTGEDGTEISRNKSVLASIKKLPEDI